MKDMVRLDVGGFDGTLGEQARCEMICSRYIYLWPKWGRGEAWIVYIFQYCIDIQLINTANMSYLPVHQISFSTE